MANAHTVGTRLKTIGTEIVFPVTKCAHIERLNDDLKRFKAAVLDCTEATSSIVFVKEQENSVHVIIYGEKT